MRKTVRRLAVITALWVGMTPVEAAQPAGSAPDAAQAIPG